MSLRILVLKVLISKERIDDETMNSSCSKCVCEGKGMKMWVRDTPERQASALIGRHV